MDFKLHIWRQSTVTERGEFKAYSVKDIDPDTSFLEMLDLLNIELIKKGENPVAFEHDCREGICGSCSMTINGRPHGPKRHTTACQLKMRSFTDGQEIYVEPWRAKAFPIIKDLVCDRNSFEKIQQAGGYISINTGSAPEANSIPIKRENAEEAFEAAACIGCGACVAACPNGSAMLFTAAKVAQYALLPQGHVERTERVMKMIKQMDLEGFGGCTNQGECEAACPKDISLKFIALMNREYFKAGIAKIWGGKE